MELQEALGLLEDFVVEAWSWKVEGSKSTASYDTSFDTAADFVATFARRHKLEFNYEKLRGRWVEYWET